MPVHRSNNHCVRLQRTLNAEKALYPTAYAIHDALSDARMTGGLEHLMQGKKRILITTEGCARGVDTPEAYAVVVMGTLSKKQEKYRIPDYVDFYHKIGRVGVGGRKGIAFVCYNADCHEDVELMSSLETYFGKKFKDVNLVGFDPDVVDLD